MPSAPHVLSLATAVPPYRLDQDDVIRRVEALFNGAPALERLLPVFANSGIRSRYSCVPIEWYDRQHGWVERLDCILDPVDAAAFGQEEDQVVAVDAGAFVGARLCEELLDEVEPFAGPRADE